MVVLVALVLTACRGGATKVDIDGLTLEAQSQRTDERIWAGVSLNLLHELPIEPDILLLKADVLKVEADGHVLVSDWGDMTVKRFDELGRHVVTYGTGIGTAPGELMSIFDFGALGDSAVYVLDGRAERISMFTNDGAFVNSMRVSSDHVRYVLTENGRSYAMIGNSSVFETSYESETLTFGSSLLDGSSQNHDLLLAGFLATYNEYLLYLPLYYPIIVQYNAMGHVIYARTSPDFGDAKPPTIVSPSPGLTRVDGRPLHGFPIVDGDRFGVFAPVDTTAIDVYDAPSGDYQFSIALPPRVAVMRNNRIYSRQDTTIAVYIVNW